MDKYQYSNSHLNRTKIQKYDINAIDYNPMRNDIQLILQRMIVQFHVMPKNYSE